MAPSRIYIINLVKPEPNQARLAPCVQKDEKGMMHTKKSFFFLFVQFKIMTH